MTTFRSLDDAEVKGKRVLLRADLNVPMHDGKVSDSTRFLESLEGKMLPGVEVLIVAQTRFVAGK